jgi:archaellum component FlaC
MKSCVFAIILSVTFAVVVSCRDKKLHDELVTIKESLSSIEQKLSDVEGVAHSAAHDLNNFKENNESNEQDLELEQRRIDSKLDETNSRVDNIENEIEEIKEKQDKAEREEAMKELYRQN